MAYQVISQNNTTTTLADENGNVIHVPARVNLATSTDYTITKVNNNTATLEDGNGNIIRDVPCVAVLYDEGGGGSSLPDQTGHSGEFLTTDGTDASWSDKPVVNTATGNNSLSVLGVGTNKDNCVEVGVGATASDSQATVVGRNASGGYDSTVTGYSTTGAMYSAVYGYSATANYQYGLAYGGEAVSNAIGAIQVGKGINADAGTFKVGQTTDGTNWTNIELLSANGTIPTARLTKVNSTITLTAAGWSGGSQTVTVAGMTATGVVMVSPDPTDQSAYTSAGIICTAQAADSLTFTCSTTPTADIDVNVVML